MSPRVDLTIEEPNWQAVEDLQRRIEEAIDCAHRLGGIALADETEISILLCDDATIQELNRLWRDKNKPTNVLSFPAFSPLPLAEKPLLGDLAIAFETTRREAEDDGKPLAEHFSHLVVHGFLHLLGYDHEAPGEADAMEALETRVLAELGIADPYAGTELLSLGTR